MTQSCRPQFAAGGGTEGCLNDSLILEVSNKQLYRKFCILRDKVTPKHTTQHTEEETKKCLLNDKCPVDTCYPYKKIFEIVLKSKTQKRRVRK